MVNATPGCSYGAKYAERSRINAVGLGANASIAPFVVGTMAMFEVITPSPALSVETVGVAPVGASRK